MRYDPESSNATTVRSLDISPACADPKPSVENVLEDMKLEVVLLRTLQSSYVPTVTAITAQVTEVVR